MDALLKSLHDVALVLMPTVGVICLILLAMILYRVYKVVSKLPDTITKVDEVIVSTKKSVDQLEAPLNTINNVSQTVDMVNSSAVSFANKAVAMSAKHADKFVAWATDAVDSRRNKKSNEPEVNKEEEDFGVYE